MKNIIRTTIILSILMSPAWLRADFDDNGAGARARAMGGAYTAISDDVFGIYYNPAGLGFTQTAQIGADFGKLYFGLDDDSNLLSGFSGIILPVIKVRTAGVSVSTASALGDSPAAVVKKTEYRHLGTFGAGMKYFSLTEHYQEAAYYLSYGRPVSNKWAWGISAKYLHEKYLIDDYLKASPVFEYGLKDSVAAASLDAGLLYNISSGFFAGISVLDINQPDLGLKYEDLLPCTARAGIAWKEKGLSWAMDAVYRNKEWIYSTGFEKFIKDVFGIRMGVGYGGKNYFNIAAGFSMRVSRLQLDYAFEYPINGIRDISGNHRMSLVFRFGRKKKEELEIGSLEYYYEKAKDEVASLTQQLAETKSEKENLEKILIEESTQRVRERIKAAKIEAQTDQSLAPAEIAADQGGLKGTRHIVRDGETLQSIARKYLGNEKYSNEIYQANRNNIGKNGALKANQVLVIPALSRQETQAEPAPQAPPAKQVEARPAETQAVESKDTGMPAAGIPVKADENRQVIKKAAASEQPAAAKPRKHIVKQGENLRSIAQKYYGDPNRWKEVYKANQGKIISGQVTPGQEITIP